MCCVAHPKRTHPPYIGEACVLKAGPGAIRALKQILAWRGKPRVIRCDNGPEHISATIQAWSKQWGIAFE
jgi:hypothetical protein